MTPFNHGVSVAFLYPVTCGLLSAVRGKLTDRVGNGTPEQADMGLFLAHLPEGSGAAQGLFL